LVQGEQEFVIEACERVKRMGDMKFLKTEHPDEDEEDWE
jgi:hypothetical protein